jgi:OmcA/MtrC family decaheme c-type cytochrome
MRFLGLALSISMLLGGVACTGDRGDQGPPGGDGNDGDSTLAVTSDEPAGANCPSGGVKLQIGIDADDDGTLDASEVQSTQYVCHGGGGHSSLVRTGTEDAGVNCPFGGTRIETGLDLNDDGTLAAEEIDASATSYVCNIAPSGTVSPTTGIVVAVKSVSPTAPIKVRFTVKDDRGFPLDLAGGYSVNTAILPRFTLAYFTRDASNLVSPYTVYTKTTSASSPAGSPTMYSPLTSTGQGTISENGHGAGDYTYTFPTVATVNGAVAVDYDATKLNETHVVWIQAMRQTDLIYPLNANTYYAANQDYNFVPSGTGTPGKREIAAQAGCDGCHGKFKTETTTANAFHGGGRIAVGMCNVCHNPGRTSNPLANSSSFIHRIHNGEAVATANRFHGIAATYPRDVRDCSTCHTGAAQGAQAVTNPTRLACAGCHDYVSFTAAAAQFCGIAGQIVYGADGKPLPCNHVGGAQATDATCATCHGPTASFPVASYHKPVAKPDPNNLWKTGGTNANTNAAFVAAGGYVPPGAAAIAYDIKSVETWTDTSVTPSVKRPSMTFKLKKDGTDVVFQTYQAGVTTELMANFVGSPSAYFVFAVPQDGITAPADFNASASAYLRNVWNGSATTGTGAGTLTGPDASGYYTIRLTGVQVPATATMLTGGLGYTYALSSTPPLVQTNVPGYPWTPNVPADGKAQGGLIVPAPNVSKVATGYTGRRNIVENGKCNSCHGALGVSPSFHAGQRNDGPTCSWCHNPNRTSSGWAAGSKYFIHAIHAGRKRTVPFTWHAASAGEGYGEIEFPGTLNTCTTCHAPGSYDFTDPTNLAAIDRMPVSAAATGTYNSDPAANSSYYTLSPYVTADGVTSYGSGFSFNAGTGATTQGAATNLVMSPITGACASCHDSTVAVNHMKGFGGKFYAPRGQALDSTNPEQCLDFHGPGRIAAVGLVHQR